MNPPINPCKNCIFELKPFTHTILITPFSNEIEGCLIARDPTFQFLNQMKIMSQKPSYTGNFLLTLHHAGCLNGLDTLWIFLVIP